MCDTKLKVFHLYFHSFPLYTFRMYTDVSTLSSAPWRFVFRSVDHSTMTWFAINKTMALLTIISRACQFSIKTYREKKTGWNQTLVSYLAIYTLKYTNTQVTQHTIHNQLDGWYMNLHTKQTYFVALSSFKRS